MKGRSSVSTPLSIQAEAELVRVSPGPRPSRRTGSIAKSTSSSSSPASMRVMYSAWSPNGSTPNPRVASQIASHVGSAFSALTQTS